MLTALHTSDTVVNHILNIMSDSINVSRENIQMLLIHKRDKKLKKLFWALLEDEYHGHPFKKIKCCEECGILDIE